MNADTNRIDSPRPRPVAAAAVLLAGGALLAGCSDPFGSSNPKPTIQAVKAGDNAPRGFDASGGARALRFEGHIDTPNDCQQIRARLDRFSTSNGVIDLFVEAEVVEPCPNDLQTTWNYLGRLRDVDAGTYDVTIEHRFKNQDVESTVVLEKQVEILPR